MPRENIASNKHDMFFIVITPPDPFDYPSHIYVAGFRAKKATVKSAIVF
jgi:hypothetical protein